jgi:hypothetical protein
MLVDSIGLQTLIIRCFLFSWGRCTDASSRLAGANRVETLSGNIVVAEDDLDSMLHVSSPLPLGFVVILLYMPCTET